MVKKIAIAVLLLTASLFAATPTGTVILSAANGACPQSNFSQALGSQTLDASGNYSMLPSAWGYLPVGAYCVAANYSGDASHNASVGYVTVNIVANVKSDTTTTVIGTPNPVLVGSNTFALSGNVQ